VGSVALAAKTLPYLVDTDLLSLPVLALNDADGRTRTTAGVHLNGLWSYASTEWLKLCVPNETDRTRSRWPIHPLWVALASVDWEASGGPLSRTFTASRAPSQAWLGARALSLIASLGSVAGLDDFDAAGEELLRAASNALGIVTKTGQTTDASGVLVVTDPALVAAVEYRGVVVLASGAQGLFKLTSA